MGLTRIIWLRSMHCSGFERKPEISELVGGATVLARSRVVVTAAALGIAVAARNWQVPLWFDTLGSSVSIVVLLLLGGMNLHALLHGDRPCFVCPDYF